MLPRSKHGRAIFADAAPGSGPAAVSAEVRHYAALRRLSSASGVSLPWSETTSGSGGGGANRSSAGASAVSSSGSGGGGGGAGAGAGAASSTPGQTPLQTSALTPPLQASPLLDATAPPAAGRPPPIAEEPTTAAAPVLAPRPSVVASVEKDDGDSGGTGDDHYHHHLHTSRAKERMVELLTPGPSHIAMRAARYVGLVEPAPPPAPPPAAAARPTTSPGRKALASCLSPFGAHRLAESCGGGNGGGGKFGDECCGGVGDLELPSLLERCLRCVRRCVAPPPPPTEQPPRVIAKGLPQPFALGSLTTEQRAELEEAKRIYIEAPGRLSRNTVVPHSYVHMHTALPRGPRALRLARWRTLPSCRRAAPAMAVPPSRHMGLVCGLLSH